MRVKDPTTRGRVIGTAADTDADLVFARVLEGLVKDMKPKDKKTALLAAIDTIETNPRSHDIPAGRIASRKAVVSVALAPFMA
jgi:hypothetical protein